MDSIANRRRSWIRLWACLGILALSLAVFSRTDLDLLVQDRLFDSARQEWRVDRASPLPRLIFYNLPKAAIIACGTVLLLTLLWPDSRKPAWWRIPWQHRRLWVLALSLAAIPALIGVMKANSHIHCPWSVDRYGGTEPYHHLFAPAMSGTPGTAGKCFPGGHASGGFALLALGHVFRRRWLGLAIGIGAGWAMGGYQMLKGAHFLSHTVVTMLIAWSLVEVIGLILLRSPRETAVRGEID